MLTSYIVELKNLNKSYDEGNKQRRVLRDLALEVSEGQMLVLLGRSGSGKSTLLNLLSGIDRPDSGEVLIDGTDISALSEKERTLFRRNQIGFVFQSFNLISTLTAFENVMLPLRLKGAVDSTSEGLAMHFLSEVGLEGRKNSYPDRLSGGEQQRVAIARALAHEPSFILADEPIASLDPLNAKVVMESLRDIHDRDGLTVICNLHTLDTARQFCDRVIGMRDGKIVFDGASSDLTRAEARNIYGADDDFEESMTSTSIETVSDEIAPALEMA